MSHVGNRLLGVIQINQLPGLCSLVWQPMGHVFIWCMYETERYFKKNNLTIDIYTQNEAKPWNNRGKINSLCQKMDCYHQNYMELIISKEL